ncbi:MAG: iron-containing alcohol dehydrogenase [Bacteroidales bacterium]|nr:iron-containing alcohol dehydrogenase [Bacteroidales bacterium]
MVKRFNFSGIPTIHFGPGKIFEIPEIIKMYGHTILLVTGSTSFASSYYASKLFSQLNNQGIIVFQTRIMKEPSPQDVDEAVSDFRGKNIDAVVAVGGGSVIDAGKAISAMIPSGEPVKDYLEGIGKKHHSGIKVPFIAVPTTSGTGSETTKNAVISEVGPEGFKRSLRHDNFMPDIALVDPELALSCPPEITAASGMDTFTQLLESYLSTKSNPLTDALALEGIKRVKQSLTSVYLNGSDLEARSNMAYASMLSGITLTNAGLGVIHGFASSLGGLYDIPHGVVCGTLMGSVNRLMVNKLNSKDSESHTLKKYAEISRIFFQETQDTGDVDLAYMLVNKIEELITDLRLPGLGAYGVTTDDLEKIALDTSNKNNPVQLDREDLIGVLSERL